MYEDIEHQQEYEQWLGSLQISKDPNYYSNLLKFSDIIVADLEKYKQHYVARKLGLDGPKLSHYKPLLEAYVASKEK